MVTTVISEDIIEVGVLYTAVGSGEDIILLEGVNAIDTGGFAAIQLGDTTSSDLQAYIFGTLLSTGSNAIFVDSGASNTTVFVGQSGTVSNLGNASGVAGMYIIGNDTNVFNHGMISGGSGIYLDAADGYIFNTGTIQATSDEDATISGIEAVAISLGGDAGVLTSHTVVNYGLISGLEYSINGTFAASGFRTGVNEATIKNFGTLNGDVALGDFADTVRNAGHIEGEVNLGGGDDVFRGLGDGTVSDDVYGGDGDDVLAGGDADDAFYGGNDNDTLRGGQGDDELYGGFGDDVASGGQGDDLVQGDGGKDTLSGNKGDDTLYGGNGTDTLYGGKGEDELEGGSNDDILVGGAGDDILTGGAGDDDFVFKGNFGNDIITDFDATNGKEDIDLSGVASIANITDLQANHMTQSGANVIIDDGMGNTITLLNVDISDLGGNDFLF